MSIPLAPLFAKTDPARIAGDIIAAVPYPANHAQCNGRIGAAHLGPDDEFLRRPSQSLSCPCCAGPRPCNRCMRTPVRLATFSLIGGLVVMMFPGVTLA